MSLMLAHFPDPLLAAVADAAEPERTQSRFRMSDPAPTPSDERAEADARLVQRMARGDKAALAEIYDRFSRPLYATALRIVSDPTDAQDLVQDTFVALWEKAGTFERERGTAFAWAVTFVRNRSIDRVRSRRRRSEILAAAAPDELGYRDDGAGPAADASAASGDQARAVRAAVAALPTEQKRALELAFFGGLTQQEIAAQLSEPLGTVKARIRRGLLKLRDSLAHRL